MITRTSRGVEVRELDRRTCDGIDVRLLWSPHTDRVIVAVNDRRAGESFEFDADPGDALAAFRHPYVYANRGHTEPTLAA
jgi:hypothetical protein